MSNYTTKPLKWKKRNRGSTVEYSVVTPITTYTIIEVVKMTLRGPDVGVIEYSIHDKWSFERQWNYTSSIEEAKITCEINWEKKVENLIRELQEFITF